MFKERHCSTDDRPTASLILEKGLKLRTMTMPDFLIDQNNPYVQNDIAKLNAPHIVANVLIALGNSKEAAVFMEPKRA